MEETEYTDRKWRGIYASRTLTHSVLRTQPEVNHKLYSFVATIAIPVGIQEANINSAVIIPKWLEPG